MGMGYQTQMIRNFGWLSSVWHINTVNPLIEIFESRKNGFKENHIAPFPEEIPNRLINLYSKKGEYVLDPFCGSGTTNYVALVLGRKTIGYDIEGKYIKITREKCGNNGLFFCKSAEKMDEVYSTSIQLCITSPPYLKLRDYSNNIKNIGNMENPYPILKKVFKEIYRVLKVGGYFCLNVSDIFNKEKREFTTFPYDLLNLCKEVNLKLENTIIWDKDINLKEWNIRNKKMVINHEYIWIFRK